MGRAPCCDKANVKRGPWSPEEDAKLKDYIEKNGNGGNWIALPQKIGLKRCGKSCRLRWLNYLRPNIKHGGFSDEEDNIILSLYISIGSRWSIIAVQLPGRTDNDIKNYWNTKLKKKLLGRHKQMNGLDSPTGSTQTNSPSLSNSALERLQLHSQLQNLQNPISSFYNNPNLWPKLHPLQQKMIQQALVSQIPNSPAPIPRTMMNHSVYHQETENYSLISPKLDSASAEQQQSVILESPLRSTQPDFDSFLNNRSLTFATEIDGRTGDFDCLKETNRSKESFGWLGEFDETEPASSNWWGSSAVLDRSQGMFHHDYGHQLGNYSM